MQPDTIIAAALQNFGGPGLSLAFIIWWSVRQDKLNREEKDQALASKKFEDERRYQLAKDQVDASNALAGALSALTNEVQGMRRQ